MVAPAQEPPVGRVLGTDDATPLSFWVALAPDQYLQLDDAIALRRDLPDGRTIRIYGMVTEMRARHEGVQFDSDVFLVEDAILPAEVSQAAKVMSTRFEPEVFVPPLPGQPVYKAVEGERDMALYFDGMDRKLPAGLTRDDEPLYVNLDFLDGTRGAHVNISGISGVATKTTYATFLLYSLFRSNVLASALNTKALIYNVKGEDLLFLDHANQRLDDDSRKRHDRLGLAPGAFDSVAFWAPPRRGDIAATPDVASRNTGVTSYFWTLAEFCRDGLLPFVFADAEDDRQQYTMVIHNVVAKLKKVAQPRPDGGVVIDGEGVTSFRALAQLIADRLQAEEGSDDWAGRAIGIGTRNAFVRRLHGAVDHLDHLIRGDVSDPERHRVKAQKQVTVIDIHNLNDRAKRFVVGVTLRRTFDDKERSGQREPLQFVVLDELNKYAPREGSSPIKEILVDMSERGRSLGIILIGAQQTASEVERRIVSNSSLRVVGRLDAAEAGRDEYGFLPTVQRQRATILKPGTMILSQPELPVPLVTQFPFPGWATRAGEAMMAPVAKSDDPFDGL